MTFDPGGKMIVSSGGKLSYTERMTDEKEFVIPFRKINRAYSAKRLRLLPIVDWGFKKDVPRVFQGNQ